MKKFAVSGGFCPPADDSASIGNSQDEMDRLVTVYLRIMTDSG